MQNQPVSIDRKRKLDWRTIILLTVFIFYLTQIGMDWFVWKVRCGNLGGDFCAYWSAGKIANESGYADMYDLDRLEEIQEPISPKDLPFAIRPVAYLPVFIIPFQLFARTDPYSGYWIWTILNLLLSIYYLRFFIQRTIGQAMDKRLLFMLLLSLPFFTNLFFGQINIWLTICIGEHLRAALAGESFQSGLWLGGLLIKPHYLVLVGLVLLIQRYTKILVGFITSATLIMGISFWMIGVDGFRALLSLWFGYAGSLPTADPYIMMNWRMVAENLTPFLGEPIAWTITILGMVITLIMALSLWRRPVPIGSPQYSVTLLGTIAATMSFTWHSHLFLGTIVLAPLAYLAQKKADLSDKILFNWVVIPALIQFFVIVLAITIRGSTFSVSPGPLLNLLYAGGQLGANMYLLYWATMKSHVSPA